MADPSDWKKKETPSPRVWSRRSPRQATKAPRKAPEKPKGGKPGIEKYQKKVEKVKSDPNAKAAEAISRLKGNREVTKQLEGMTALNQATLSILTKLGKKDVDISKIKDVKQLQREVIKSGITLTLPERVALENLDRIAGESGPTATEVKNSWPKQKAAAIEASKGYGEKYKEHLKKNPGGTIALTIAGAAGIYLTYQGIKSLFKKATGKTEAGKDSWFKKELMIPLILMMGGAFLGKDVMKRIITEAGLDWFDVQDKIKKGKELTAEQKKKLKDGKVGSKIKDAMNKRGNKGGSDEKPSASSDDSKEEPAVPGALEPSPEAKRRAELKEAGEKLLKEKNAHELKDGNFLVTTAKRKCWFKFDQDSGKWQWQSETERKKDEWNDCGTDYYNEEKFADAKVLNEISRSLGELVEKKGGREKAKEVGEKISEEAEKKAVRYNSVSHTLTGLYCMDADKYREVKPKILIAFEFMHETALGKILDEYKKAKNSKKVALESIGINENADTDEEAVFHALHIIQIAYEESSKIGKVKPSRAQKLEDFFNELGKDPTLEISKGVQDSIEERMKSMNITSVSDLLKAREKIFDDKTIDELFEKNKEKFVAHLAHRYGIEMSGFEKKEKSDFLFIVGSLYIGGFKLDQTTASISKIATNRGANKKVKEASIKFVNSLKHEVIEKGGLLDSCVKRYDIKRPDSEKYDQVLQKYLKPDLLHFQDGFQMALLSDGIKIDEQAEYESVGQAKDVTMIYLMVNILKKRSPNEAYPLYVGNIINLASNQDVDLNINPNFKFIAPYFHRLFGAMLKKTKSWLRRQLDIFEALKDTNEDPDKIPKLANMDTFEFVVDASRSGVRGAYEIPKELVLSVYENFSDAFDSETDGNTILKMVLAMGGTITYSRHEGRDLGLVYLAGKYYFVKPINIAWDTAVAGVTEGPGTAAKMYLLGASPFVVIGAGAASVKAAATGGSILKSALRGAGRGLAAPISMPVAGFRRLRGIGRASKYVWNVSRGRTISNLEMSSHLFRRYNNLTTSATTGSLDMLKAWRQQPLKQARKLLYHDIYNSARQRWAKMFSVNYNSFWGINPEIAQEGTGSTLRAISYKDVAFFDSPDFIARVERMEEVLESMKKIENFDSLSEQELFTELKKFLKDPELKALKNSAKENGFVKFRKLLGSQLDASKTADASRLSRLKQSVQTTASKIGEGGSKLRQRLRRTPKAEGLDDAAKLAKGSEKMKGAAKTVEAFNGTKKNLASVQRQVKAAEGEIELLNRMRKGSDKFKIQKWDSILEGRLQKARQVIAEGRIAESEIKAGMKALTEIGEAEHALDAAKKAGVAEDIAKAATRLTEVQEASKGAVEMAEITGKNITKLGKLGTAFKWGGRALGGLGFAFSAWESGNAFWEAGTTNVEGRGTIKVIEGSMFAVNAAADAAALAVLLGAKGTAASFGAAAALPLAPIVYAGSIVLETKYEETRTDYEWIQGDPSAVMHSFYTSANYISLGDAWLVGTHWEHPEERMATKRETMRKIFRGLVAIQNDKPTGEDGFEYLLNFIHDKEKYPDSESKNKEIEARIAKNYSKYHELYFREMICSNIRHFQDAEKFVLEAQMFHEIMTKRDEAVAAGKPFVIGNTRNPDSWVFTLHNLDRYAVNGNVDNPTPASVFFPSQIVEVYKEQASAELLEGDEILKDNLSRMDTSYLLRLAVQIQKKLSAGKDSLDENEAMKLKGSFIFIQRYLEIVKSINFTSGLGQPSLHTPEMDLDTLVKHLDSLGSGDNQMYLDFEKKYYRMTPALQALYRLGQYFGYKGQPKEADLKNFFNASRGAFQGVYWDGTSWVLSERGYESDNELSEVLNTDLINKLVEGMRAEPDNILEHRHDSLPYDSYDYKTEVLGMAKILDEGLKEGQGRGYAPNIELKEGDDFVPPPRVFNPKKLDYSLPVNELKNDFGKVIDYTVTQTGWNSLVYEIKNENHIVLTRKDGGSTTNLHREGNSWRVGNKESSTVQGFTLVQAVALGNLANWTEQWIQTAGVEPGVPKPFHVDGSQIEYDTDDYILDTDTVFMKHWNEFYGRIGLSQQRCVDVLNFFFGK